MYFKKEAPIPLKSAISLPSDYISRAEPETIRTIHYCFRGSGDTFIDSFPLT